MTMSRAGGLLEVLTPLSDCRQKIRRSDGTEKFGGFVVVLDLICGTNFAGIVSGCASATFSVLWVFVCPS